LLIPVLNRSDLTAKRPAAALFPPWSDAPGIADFGKWAKMVGYFCIWKIPHTNPNVYDPSVRQKLTIPENPLGSTPAAQ
jgi:hypothetical protein